MNKIIQILYGYVSICQRIFNKNKQSERVKKKQTVKIRKIDFINRDVCVCVGRGFNGVSQLASVQWHILFVILVMFLFKKKIS